MNRRGVKLLGAGMARAEPIRRRRGDPLRLAIVIVAVAAVTAAVAAAVGSLISG